MRDARVKIPEGHARTPNLGREGRRGVATPSVCDVPYKIQSQRFPPWQNGGVDPNKHPSTQHNGRLPHTGDPLHRRTLTE